ncbi:MAG: four helix bundle protein [Candidatus Marinimicrobia bacterium]|nr:four helix bundle protein [Candidatus Neomarinimicrobiota bacterium]MCF7828069.1 four helix bundle protein [Candidatus Neomarinimicrobiota bacterium]MCF7879756.1 four helix bundle protein [Candidatus Neomarinimicrobiota bacterium]
MKSQDKGKPVKSRTYFDHEKLKVYQISLKFLGWLEELFPERPKGRAVIKQLDRAAVSIPLNIAEGNGKYTQSDRCNYFDIARGSALECAASLDVLVAQGIKELTDIESGKGILRSIVSMLVGLIKANSDRVHDPLDDVYASDFDEA